MSVLYIQEQGSHIAASDGRIIVDASGTVTSIPSETLESIVIFGRVQLNESAVKLCLKNGIAVTWLSSKGEYFGRLESTSHTNILKQRSQFKAQMNEEFNLALAKIVLSAKIKNQAVIVRRYNKNTHDEELYATMNEMMHLRKNIEEASDLSQLIGYEGIASKKYFRALSQILKEDFKFESRTRQPPKDGFNSLLSFGYTLLFYEIYTTIVNSGLNPYAGFIHQDRTNHPTLVSDMMEEWRAVIIDSMVLNAISRNMFKQEDFITDEQTGGVYLKNEVIRKFVTQYENKVKSSHHYLSYLSTPMSFRRSIYHQISSLVHVFKEEDPGLYKPVLIR